MLGATKPDPVTYEAVRSATGALPARILFFDDVEAHIITARVAGWQAELIDPTTETADQLLAHLAMRGIAEQD